KQLRHNKPTMSDPQDKGPPYPGRGSGYSSAPDSGGGSGYSSVPDPVAKHLGKATTQARPNPDIAQLDAAIRGFERAKAFALEPGISEEQRQNALGAARQIGGQLQRLGYEYGEPAGWPYLKPTQAAPYYPKIIAQHLSSGLPVFSTPSQPNSVGPSSGSGM